ncbi:phage holin family protein [Allobranchiibius sp. CTAmp26]|uniref:phage holin family protein n=1 Tax=Allobranchiibius sp. CTAmp26 TaxID=2815214 RepID=UPI001AA181BE|nr:phage holin family protein [Allobranchiibius sp. CTAmp26]MBO1756495.1 phage holin family protein [Allobranchiibius sp. CTAmp26]
MSDLREEVQGLREEVTGLGGQLPPSGEEKAAVRDFVADATRDVKTLMRQEVELAKAEIGAEVGKVGKGAGMVGGAGFAAVMAVIFASTAAWWGLGHLIGTAWAALVVALVWALIAAVLFLVGRGVLRSISLTPKRTIDSVKRIPSTFTARGGDRHE